MLVLKSLTFPKVWKITRKVIRPARSQDAAPKQAKQGFLQQFERVMGYGADLILPRRDD